MRAVMRFGFVVVVLLNWCCFCGWSGLVGVCWLRSGWLVLWLFRLLFVAFGFSSSWWYLFC